MPDLTKFLDDFEADMLQKFRDHDEKWEQEVRNRIAVGDKYHIEPPWGAYPSIRKDGDHTWDYGYRERSMPNRICLLCHRVEFLTEEQWQERDKYAWNSRIVKPSPSYIRSLYDIGFRPKGDE